MLYVGQIMRHKTTGEIGFFEGLDFKSMKLRQPLRVITKTGFANYDDFNIIWDKEDHPISGNFVLDNKIESFFGKLNRKGINELRKNWDRYSEIEE